MNIEGLLILVAIVFFIVALIKPTRPAWDWTTLGLVFFAAAHAWTVVGINLK